MKKLIFVIILATPMAAETFTFVFGESYRTIKSGSAFQTNVLWAQTSLSNRAGLFGWAQYSTTYQQAYGGVYVKPLGWLQVGAATGQEQFSRTPRLGTFGFASNAKANVFGVYENFGATGYWYLVQTDLAVSKRVSIGTLSQAFIGHGPRVEIKLGTIDKWTVSLRPAATWDRQSGLRPNILIGLRLTYFKGE